MINDLMKMVLIDKMPLVEAGKKFNITPAKVKTLISKECWKRNCVAWKQSQANYDGIRGFRRLAERFIETEST